jgi:hypothetical protein
LAPTGERLKTKARLIKWQRNMVFFLCIMYIN